MTRRSQFPESATAIVAVGSALTIFAVVASVGCSGDDATPNGGTTGTGQDTGGATLDTNGGAFVPDTGNQADSDKTEDSAAAGQDSAVPAQDTNGTATTKDTVTADTATPIDAGTAKTDGGTLPVDAGTPEIDAGTPEIDAGTPEIDAGPPPVDAVTSPVDAGAAPADKIVRFAALGDTGTGSDKQYKVGKQLAAKCKKDGCDFVLLLGDNFYDVGVDSENDKQFKTKFEDPYKDVEAPFYVTLGNHDYGGGGTGGEFMKKEHYIKYAKKNPKFVLPEAYWAKKHKHVEIFNFDSNAMMFSDLFKNLTDEQIKVMKPAMAASKAQWKISFSHHPYRSNGPHGNAGCYEGVKMFTPLACGIVPILSGKGVKEAFDDMICGQSDVHFSGHDHSFQWLKKDTSTKYCKGVELIVAGSGAKTTEVHSKDKGGLIHNPTHYQNADVPGFLWVEINGNKFSGTYYDMDGKQLFERSFTK